MLNTRDRIKYLHWYTLNEEDFFKMFQDALKYSQAMDALVRFFTENKKWLKIVNDEVTKPKCAECGKPLKYSDSYTKYCAECVDKHK